MFRVTNSCGRCGNLVDFNFVHVAGSGEHALDEVVETSQGFHWQASSPNRSRSDDHGPTISAHGVGICPRCNGPTLFDFITKRRFLENIKKNLGEASGLWGGASLIDVKATYPPVREPESDPTWPQELVRQFADAQKMLDQNMTPSIIITTCRTVLDIATKKLDEKLAGKPLQKRIEGLLQAGIITKPIADWGHAIRLDGNEAVHEGVGEVTEAQQYIAFLKMFLNMAFALPARIEARQDKGSVK